MCNNVSVTPQCPVPSAEQPEEFQTSPVVVGGLGGSGTRAVAGLLQGLGYFLGSDLNPALDNLWFTYLFRRRAIRGATDQVLERRLRLFVRRMTTTDRLAFAELRLIGGLALSPDTQQSLLWRLGRARSLLSPGGYHQVDARWGWKEPNTHILLEPMAALMPRLRYILVLRHGLDMASSSNQNQLRFWHGVTRPTARESLRFWRRCTESTLETAQGMSRRFLLLNFDRLCTEPWNELRRLTDFLDIDVSRERLDALTEKIHVPSSTGRFRRVGLDVFDVDDVRFVESMGFDCSI